MSKIVEVLMHEHEEIVKFVEQLRNMCLEFVVNDKINISDFRQAVEFIKTYADERHHQKEEQLLFKSMMDILGKKAENLIKYGMLIEHDLARYHVKSLDQALTDYETSKTNDNKLNILCHALAYCDLLNRHVYKENNVVYPFGERNLPKEELDKLDIEVVEYEKKYL